MNTALERAPRSGRPQAAPTVRALTVSGEFIAYVLIGIVALLLRFIDLGALPLSNTEAYHALAALRFVDPTVAGPALPPASPALFAGQALAMGVFGATETTARLFVALAGMGLALAPALWRAQLGRLPALVFAALLACSPTAVAAARFNEGATLSAALALLVVWLAWRFHAQGGAAWGATGGPEGRWWVAWALAIALAALVLLVEPGGLLMALCLLAGLGLMVALDEEGSVRMAVTGTARAFPWRAALVGAAASVAVVATLLFANPPGLSAVGEVLGGFVEGLTSRTEGQPFALPILALLVYEPLVWLFGGIGLVRAMGSDRPMGRFLAGWAHAALVICLVYPGAVAAHALLMVVPLAALAGRAAGGALPARDEGHAPRDAEAEDVPFDSWAPMWQTPEWGLPAYIAGLVALAAAVYLNLMIIGRDVANLALAAETQTYLPRLLMVALSLILIVIVFFLVGATWGSRTALRGLNIAAVLVLGVYTLSAAWGLAVTRADDPRELWYGDRPTHAIHALVQALAEGSERDQGAPTTAPVAAQVPPGGALAWALRGFRNLTFIEAPSARVATPLVVLPADDTEPVLGADYVGQGFVVRRTFRFDTVGTQGLLGWLLQRYTYAPPMPAERYIVWMRTDIYGTAGASQP